MELDTCVCMDALEFLKGLPDGSVDLVVTSPPYNIQRKNSKPSGAYRNRKRGIEWDGYDEYHDDMPEPDYQAWLRSVVAECLRVSKGLAWLNHKTRFRNGAGIHPLTFLPFPLWSEVVWDRMGSMALNSRRFAPSHEYVFGFGRPHYWNDEFNINMSVWHMAQESEYLGHPCPYPQALISPLIQASCPDGGTVLDPFFGSGTTGVVAQKLGRHYIGCEISATYCDIARKRLAKPYTADMYAVTP